MANVLSKEKREQVLALGRLGWTLRRIEDATGVRRETASGYLKAAGIAVREPGRWGRAAYPAIEVSTDSGPDRKPANEVSPDSGTAPSTRAPKPANEVSLDSASVPTPTRGPSASACQPYADFIELSLSKGRNAKAIYQDLVDDHGFRGRYHVLGGVLDPMRGIGPDQLHIRELFGRLADGTVQEVILATDPNTEGEATAAYLGRQLATIGVAVTRLASGLPMGGDLELADEVTLGRAFAGRRRIDA